MAKYQYRISGIFDWMANSGNAIISIYNPPGSGKKLTIRSLEATNLTSSDTVTAGTVSAGLPRYLTVARATVSGGTVRTPLAMDSDASAWPSTVPVTDDASVTSPGVAVKRIMLLKQMNQNSLSWLGMADNKTPMWAGIARAPRRGSTSPVEGTVVRAGESLAVFPASGYQAVPVVVTATLVRSGTPNRTYTVTYFTHTQTANQSIFTVENQAGSGETVTLVELSVAEVGTYDSPYFQVVPMGPIDVTAYDDPQKAVSPLAMDSTYPSPSSWMKVLQNVPFLPLDMPENALSDGGSGSPKGFNYLKSKDFLGPVWRAYFPEHLGANQRAALPDALGFQNSHRQVDMLFRRAGVTLREGEGLALVSGAETAVVAFAVGMSGWSSWHFAAQVDVEPSFAPTLTLTGLKVGTEIRIYEAGTTTLITGEESIVSGTFSWVFDPAEHPSVDISILALGYQNTRLLAQALTLADTTIPIQQQIDRQYENP